MSMQEDKKEVKLSKEETIKEKSNYLRGSIKKELIVNSSYFQDESSKLLKFHGVYQQDNRDTRQERTSKGQEKEYSFMIRTKLPGGILTPQQYLRLNEICENYSNKTLRITTRQTIQFHGVLKNNLHKTLNEINKSLITTYGACGDVVRNVITCPVCDIDQEYSISLNQYAKEVSNHLLPNSKAYYEIWVNDEKIDLGKEQEEKIYGKTYLPRKFKIGLSLPEDNCIDIFTQDIGLVAICQGKSLYGFNLLVGGGLGHTHNKPETYPRLASELGFITLEKLIKTIESIVIIQKDYGNRENRKHARLKYLIDDKGIEWFRNELERRIGFKLEKTIPVNSYSTKDHIGWHKQKNELWYIGIFIENGRILNNEKRKIKTGLKEIIEKFKPNVRLSAQQNIILTDIKEEDKEKINELLKKYNIYTLETVSILRRNSMACPALPTCGLALAEAERALPKVIDELEQLGFGKDLLTIRMSGCPNSCPRSPVAELGIIGTSANKYNIYIGGRQNGTSLNKLFKEGVLFENLVTEISEILKNYKSKMLNKESFGDFCNRVRN